MVRAFAQGGKAKRQMRWYARARRVPFEVVQALVEGHDVEKTGISVDDLVSKEGKNSRGRPNRRLY